MRHALWHQGVEQSNSILAKYTGLPLPAALVINRVSQLQGLPWHGGIWN